MVKEALVVCSDKNIGVGITIWDIDTGDQLLHIPTCASSFHGLLSFKNQFIVASQAHKNGSLGLGGGAIFFWPLSKPQSQLRSYPIEAIGPICCTKTDIYLAGGAPSGNVYLWEIASGKLLKSWHAYHTPLTSMIFSNDGSLLISGSADGMIHVWSMISLLDVADCRGFPILYYSRRDHKFSISSLLCSSTISIFISSSLDGTCKVWDMVIGRILQTQVFPVGITSIAMDPGEQLLLSGSVDGRIFIKKIDIGLMENHFPVAEDQPTVLNGHKRCVTGLAFCRSGLVSTSEDSTACLWNVVNWVIIRRFDHKKGAITNLLVIPQSSLLLSDNHHRIFNQSRVSLLDKYHVPPNSNELTSHLYSPCSLNDLPISIRGIDSLNQQILDLESGRTPAVIQLKVETSVENRVWATRMTKHVMDMNKHLQSRFLDLMQCRLLWPPELESPTKKMRKKLKIESSSLLVDERSQFPPKYVLNGS